MYATRLFFIYYFNFFFYKKNFIYFILVRRYSNYKLWNSETYCICGGTQKNVRVIKRFVSFNNSF